MRTIEYVNPNAVEPPIGQYSNVAVVAANARIAHIAGQLPLDSDAMPVAAGDFAAQARFVFASLAAILEALGTTFGHLAFLRTYMTGLDDYPVFKAVRAQVYEHHGVSVPPPATTLVVSELVGGSLIELDAVAVLPGDTP